MLVRGGKTQRLKKFPVLVMYILVQSVLFSTVHACCGTSSSALLSLLQKVMVLHFSAKHNLMILSHCTFIHHSQKENTKFFLNYQPETPKDTYLLVRFFFHRGCGYSIELIKIHVHRRCSSPWTRRMWMTSQEIGGTALEPVATSGS